MPSRPITLMLLGAASVMLLAHPALAYEQTMTCNPSGIYACRPGEVAKGVHWDRRDLEFVINQRGSKDIAPGPNGRIADTLITSIRESFQTWTQPDCAELRITFKGLTDREDVGFTRGEPDNANIVMWREQWPYPGARSAYALTSVTFSVNTGVISDADIELNGDLFTWSDEPRPAPTDVDVRNTLVHEVGHFIGLDHSPNTEATMYAMAPEGEIKKRTLHEDDIAGVCAIYPPLPPDTEWRGRDGEGCCQVAPAGPVGPGHKGAWLALGLLGALCARRHRRSA